MSVDQDAHVCAAPAQLGCRDCRGVCKDGDMECAMLKVKQPVFCPKLEPFDPFRQLAGDLLSSQRSRSGQKARRNTNILVDFKEV